MTETPSRTLVFKDRAGSYFLVPIEVVERGRVPADQQAELERQMAETVEDVQGYRVALYEGDPGNKGRPRGGVPPTAAGSGDIVTPLLTLVTFLTFGPGVPSLDEEYPS
jgi:hypothetical protein